MMNKEFENIEQIHDLREKEMDYIFEHFFRNMMLDAAELPLRRLIKNAFSYGVHLEQCMQWSPCDGEILPPYHEVVIVRLVDKETGEYCGETFMHRSDDPNVYKDEYGWCLTSPFKHTHWCLIPKFHE